MRTIQIALFIGACGFMAFAARANTNKPVADTTDNIVVAAVSADPFATSGVIAFAVEISTMSEESKTRYYIPYMRAGQPKPRIGQTCSVSWQWHDSFDWITAKGSVQGIRLVTKFSCDGGPNGSF